MSERGEGGGAFLSLIVCICVCTASYVHKCVCKVSFNEVFIKCYVKKKYCRACCSGEGRSESTCKLLATTAL